MKFKIIFTAFCGVLIASCEQAQPPEPKQNISRYATGFIEAEANLAAGNSVGVLYLHPMRKYACNTMQVRISRNVYNGLEYNWEVADILEVKEQNSAPEGRRNIGTHPVLFHIESDTPHRIDAISCTAFGGTQTTQYRDFAEFKTSPGDVAFIGSFEQTRLAEGVDLYIPKDNFDAVKEQIGLDSKMLQLKISKADVTYFSFENFDGQILETQQIIDNVSDSGDYFTLSQTLKMQANDALLPFVGYLPAFDPPHITRQNLGNIKEELEGTMLSALDLTLLRLDMKAEFEAIIEAKQSYKTARNHINHRLAVANSSRARNGYSLRTREVASLASKRYSIALKDRDAFMRANDIAKITDQLISKEQKKARESWKDQLKRMAYVLTQQFSGSADVLKRDRVKTVLDEYTPAKYASLKIELTQMAERQNKAITEIRRLRKLLDSAEANENIILEELVSNFLQETLVKNEAYHTARVSFDNNWVEIFEIIDFIQ